MELHDILTGIIGDDQRKEITTSERQRLNGALQSEDFNSTLDDGGTLLKMVLYEFLSSESDSECSNDDIARTNPEHLTAIVGSISKVVPTFARLLRSSLDESRSPPSHMDD